VLKMTGNLPAGFQLTGVDIALSGASAAPAPAAPPSEPAEASAPDPAVGIATAVEATTAPSPDAPKEADKPAVLEAPRAGKADDLKRIKGIGRQNEARLNTLGIWHYDQIAAWSAREVAWVGAYLAFPGRIERERWVDQAAALARGEATDFAKRVDRGEVSTSAGGATVPPEATPPVSAPSASMPDLVADAPMPEQTPTIAPAAPAATDVAPTDYRPPNAIDAPRNGKPDRLSYVNGIDEPLERSLNGLGIFHFQQLAQLAKDDLAALSVALGRPGKAIEDNWKGEAAMLAIGSDTEHSKAMKRKASGDATAGKG